MKRRDLIGGIAATTVAAILAACSKANNDDAGDASSGDSEENVDFLFVQHSSSVTLKDGVLTLQGVAADTLYFSDRPDRIVGRVTTQEFVDNWSEGDDSFTATPPNAVLSTVQHDVSVDVVVVLTEPQLSDGALIYNVEILDGEPEIDSGASALFIDVVGRPLTPVSVAGVRRREMRRSGGRRVIR
jgi:hypothetical protein